MRYNRPQCYSMSLMPRIYSLLSITYPYQDLKAYATPERYPLVALADFVASTDLRKAKWTYGHRPCTAGEFCRSCRMDLRTSLLNSCTCCSSDDMSLIGPFRVAPRLHHKPMMSNRTLLLLLIGFKYLKLECSECFGLIPAEQTVHVLNGGTLVMATC